MSHLDLTIWIVGFVLQLAVIVVLIRRRPVGQFRGFLAFLVCLSAGDLLTVWLRANTNFLYFMFWGIQAVDSAVALAAIIEIFRDALQLVYRRFGVIGLFGPFVIFALVDFFFWRTLHHKFTRDWLGIGTSVAVSLVLGISLLQLAIGILCLWLRHRYGIFTRRSLSVLSGFGLIGASFVLTFIVRVEFGPRLEDVFRYISPFAAMCAMLIWILIFSLPEPEEDRRRPDLERIDRFLEFANRYVEDAREAMRRWGLRFGFE
jgi:hypothetical protein